MRHLKTFAPLRAISKARATLHEAAVTARTAEPVVAKPYGNYLHMAPGFRQVYQARAGGARRSALLAFFQRFPEAHLPINNHYQANMLDNDLAVLVKRGFLRQMRNGGRGNALDRSSAKRQSYLVLA
jgi:hypothetical protein